MWLTIAIYELIVATILALVLQLFGETPRRKFIPAMIGFHLGAGMIVAFIASYTLDNTGLGTAIRFVLAAIYLVALAYTCNLLRRFWRRRAQ